jgi:hypothetical protein
MDVKVDNLLSRLRNIPAPLHFESVLSSVGVVLLCQACIAEDLIWPKPFKCAKLLPLSALWKLMRPKRYPDVIHSESGRGGRIKAWHDVRLCAPRHILAFHQASSISSREKPFSSSTIGSLKFLTPPYDIEDATLT